jgi:hypothetical protein
MFAQTDDMRKHGLQSLTNYREGLPSAG